MITSFENFFSKNDDESNYSEKSSFSARNSPTADESHTQSEYEGNYSNNYENDDIKSYHEDVSGSDYEEDFEEMTPKSSFRLPISPPRSPRSMIVTEEPIQLRSISPSIASNEDILDESLSNSFVSNHILVTCKQGQVIEDKVVHSVNAHHMGDEISIPIQSTSVQKENIHVNIKSPTQVHVASENVTFVKHQEANQWNKVFKTNNTKKSNHIDLSSQHYPVVTLYEQVMPTLSMYSSVKRVDPYTKAQLERSLPVHQGSHHTTIAAVKHQQHDDNDINVILQGLISDAAATMIKEDRRHKLLQNVTIPVSTIIGGFSSKDIHDMDEEVQEAENNNLNNISGFQPHSVLSDAVNSIKKLHQQRLSAEHRHSILSSSSSSHRSSSHKPTSHIKKVASRSSSTSTLTVTPTPTVSSLGFYETEDERLKQLLHDHKQPSTARSSTAIDEEVKDVSDEYARMCVRRPDIAAKCEEYYANFLSKLIDMCKEMNKTSNTPEDLAMHKVLLDYIHQSFVSSNKIKDLRLDMVRAAFITGEATKPIKRKVSKSSA